MNITIIGAGKLGVMLAKTLTAENHDITVIDINEDKVEKLAEMLDVQGVGGSATHYNVLEEADMKNCDLLICTTASDEKNSLSCQPPLKSLIFFSGSCFDILLRRLQSGIKRILSFSICLQIFKADEDVTHTSQIVLSSLVVLIYATTV